MDAERGGLELQQKDLATLTTRLSAAVVHAEAIVRDCRDLIDPAPYLRGWQSVCDDLRILEEELIVVNRLYEPLRDTLVLSRRTTAPFELAPRFAGACAHDVARSYVIGVLTTCRVLPRIAPQIALSLDSLAKFNGVRVDLLLYALEQADVEARAWVGNQAAPDSGRPRNAPGQGRLFDGQADDRQIERLLLDENASRIAKIAGDRNKSADDRMREILRIDRTFAGKNSREWAELLGCSPQNVRDTDCWRTDIPKIDAAG